ncbi:MAG: RNA polymerase sigma factor [Candidatus Competibacteraceae bacterium]|jgi:RNA polymerase sigma-70 factor (ECF subfamily)|nr:RNA polymerase sigma factor [Candidatus Competibacteraceae bacterium]
MSSQPLSHHDHELIAQFRKGDADAFVILMERHQDRVYRLACVFLHRLDDAADVVQEVFIRAYKSLQRFFFRAQLSTWLYQTTRNVCSEFNRRTPPTAEPDLLQAGPDCPHTELESTRRMLRIRCALTVLSERQRSVVVLRYFESLSTAETARMLGCREGTVKATLHQAMKVLKSRLTTFEE